MALIPRDFFNNDFLDDFKGTNKLRADIYEKDGYYHIEIDLFKIEKDNINIDVSDGYLTVYVSQEDENEDKSRHYIRKERCSRHLKRSFYVGNIDRDGVKAKLNEGILNITVPLNDEKPNRKKITIE